MTEAYEAAEALIDLLPASASVGATPDCADIGLVTARMMSSRDECSDRSLGLFAKIAARRATTWGMAGVFMCLGYNCEEQLKRMSTSCNVSCLTLQIQMVPLSIVAPHPPSTNNRTRMGCKAAGFEKEYCTQKPSGLVANRRTSSHKLEQLSRSKRQ